MKISAVSVRGLVRRYGTHTALGGVDADFADGELTLLLGANGAGKTTLLHVLAGLTRPDAGEVGIDGTAFDPREPAQRGRVGLVAHETLLYGPLSIRENLEFHASLYGVAAERIDAVLDEMGLSDRADTRVGGLSHGYRKRVGLARALLHEPELLLLDEPFTGLDPGARDRVIEMLGGLVQPGRTIVLATHAVEAALPVAGQALVLAEGRVVHRGATHGMEASDLLVMFGGAAP